MGYKVAPSFDYANICVDYEKKKVDVSYPYKSSFLEDFILFSIFGIFFYVGFGFFFWSILDIFFLNGVNPFINCTMSILLMYLFWLICCYKTTKIRQRIIEIASNENEQNMIYLSGIRKKKVRISNIGNNFTKYQLFYDYKKYIKKFEIKCVKKIYKNKKNKKKIFSNLFSNPNYIWKIYIEFAKIPKKGHMIIYNQRGEYDEIVGNGDIVVDTY